MDQSIAYSARKDNLGVSILRDSYRSVITVNGIILLHCAVTFSSFPNAGGDNSTDGNKAKELRLAQMRVIRGAFKDSTCVYYNPMELRIAEAELLKPTKLPPCPHQGNKNSFSFIFCKPDCARSVTDPLLSGHGFDHCNIKDNSNDPGNDEEQKDTKQNSEMAVDICSEFEGDLKGTTINAIAGVKGIFIASYGKTMEYEGGNTCVVLEWNYPKIAFIFYHIMATTCGSINQSQWIIDKVSQAVENQRKMLKGVVVKIYKKYMNTWNEKENRNSEFRGVVMVFVFSNGNAILYSVGTDEHLNIDTWVYGCSPSFEVTKEHTERKL